MSHYSQIVRESRANAYRAERTVRNIVKAGGVDLAAIAAGGGGGLGGLLGGGMGQRKLQAAYGAFKGHVYTCIKVIAQRLAGLPYGAGEVVNDDQPQEDEGKAQAFGTKLYTAGGIPWDKSGKVRRRHFPTWVKNAVGGAAVEAYMSHPALDMLNRPNPNQGKFEFLYVWVANMYLAGEAYWISGEGEDGPEMWMPPTNWIVPKHEGGLFTSYELKPPGASTGIPLDAELVRRTYFPDPQDIKGCVSPVIANLSAVKVDESIQKSQEQMFDRGIFPNVVLTVGDRKNADGTPGGKPTLTGPQRRQVIRAVREVWAATMSNGDPAIVDGLISGIHKLNNMPAEMDWLNSGEQVKKRIFQAFGVNPIVVGEIAGANRAQAAVAEQNFLSNVINPLVDDVTVVLNEFVAPMFSAGEKQAKAKDDKPDGKQKLCLWLEEGTPLDEELKLRKFSTGRTNNDCTRNEYRTEVLGLPPIEEEEDTKRVPLLDTVGGATAIVSVLTAVGSGTMGPESAVEAFKLLFELDDAAAQALVGDTGELGQMALLAPEPAPFGSGGKPPKKPPKDDEDADDPPLPDVDEEAGDEPAKGVKAPGLPKIKRSIVKASNRRQQVRLEREVAARLRPFSRASIGRQLLNLLASQTEN